MIGEGSYGGGIVIFGLEECFEFWPIFRRDGEDHSFLGFADPDFVVSESFVFEGDFIEIDFGAEFFGHFADGAGESACAAVGDGVVEASLGGISGLEDDVEDFLFGDGVADLDGV